MRFSQECDSGLKAGEPLLQDVILYGRELTQDDLFDDNEKENITRDMAQLQENYDDMRNFVDDEQERFAFSVVLYIRLFIISDVSSISETMKQISTAGFWKNIYL